MNETFEQIESLVLDWAYDRNILKPDDNGAKQLLKMFEEAGELSRAYLKQDQNGIKDGIGDVLVTLILFAYINGYDVTDCLAHAYNEIKDRKGKTVNGTFIKEQ